MNYPLLGAAFKNGKQFFTFHGYTMESPANPRITYLSEEIGYAEEWKKEWGNLHHAKILKHTNGFIPRNHPKYKGF